MLQIYNSLTRRKERFRPLEPGRVRMYVCGMTVYDYCHLGHARVLVVFDVVVRYLRAAGLDVTYIRNITDIDDKIIKRAHENGEDYRSLTEQFIRAMHEDVQALGVLPPTQEPRATAFIEPIIQMIRVLVDKGYAYQAENGDVYYDVSRFHTYGHLSGRRIEELRAGARVEVGEAKEDPLDFVLWKAAKLGEPSWNSPWGPGRPGWHIECSAMSTQCLGAHFDIHGGGMDLQFPHHENEIAQSEACTGQRFVNVWMHNGFVRVADKKMSKSLGNFFTVREVLQSFRPEVVRYFILSSHYRSPLNYSEENLHQAKAALDRLYLALRGLPATPTREEEDDYVKCFHAAMEDDFNTPEALAVLRSLAHEINTAKTAHNEARAAHLGITLKRLGGILGLLQARAEDYLKALPGGGGAASSGRSDNTLKAKRVLSDGEIEQLIAERSEARRRKDWAEADRLRDQLLAQGIVLEDGAGGTVWRCN
jgi:cysteinyl-tRNA synthetase